MKNMKTINKFLSVCFLSILSFSCNIGLGEAVDLMPPELTITKPEIASSVNRTIELTGYATDNMAVTSIDVTVEEAGLSYKWEKNQWFIKNGEDYKPYSNAIITTEENRVDFTLFIDIEGKQSGENITISTQAHDELGNAGGKSKDERNVTLDISAPTVSVVEPSLTSSYTKASADFESYVLRENSVLSYLVNQDVTFSGAQKEDTKLQKLSIYLDGSSESTLPEKESEIKNTIYKKEFEGTGIRNWNFVMKAEEFPENYKSGKHLIRVFTYSYDTAGNCESKVQGWFTYWNEADKPWVSMNVGEDKIENLKEENQTYPNAQLLGQSYDDDGLKSISFKTVKVAIDGNGKITENEVTELTKVVNLESEGNPKYYPWATNAISDLGKFYILVVCTDINGKESEPVKKYFEVADITPPTIIIENDQELKLPLDKTKFTIKGVLKDDGGAKKLMMVKLSGALGDEQRVEYLNGYKVTEEGKNLVWNKGDVGSGKDKFGNSIWILDDNKLGTPEQKIDGVERTFEFNLDWQTDLGIKTDLSSAEKLISQTFILCVIDGQNLSTTQQITFAGDSQRPSLTIDTIKVISSSGVQIGSANWNNGNPTLSPYNRDGSLNIIDKIRLYGTWSDNSKYTSGISLSWQDYLPNITIHKNADGTWYSDDITPQDKMTSVLEASIEDLGGNITEITKNFTVDGAIGQYNRISSELSGSYKAGTQIDIYVQFTKAVTFKDGTAAPYLVLSNGKNATYVEGNGTSEKQIFRYTVGTEASENTAIPLTVTKIVTNGHKWYDGPNAIWNKDGKSEISESNIPLNLNLNRNIYIDNIAPKLTDIKVTTPTGSYAKGKVINITGTFSEEVTDTSGLQLTLNTGKQTTSAKATGANGVIFTYTVAEGDNVSNLSVTNIAWGSIKDKAGNAINKTTPTYTGFTGISLDTTKPNKPTITVSPTPTGAGSTKVIYNSENVTVTVQYDSTEKGTKNYTTEYKGGSTNWSPSTTGNDGKYNRTLGNGEYIISAVHEDEAGNISDVANQVQFKVDYGHILKSVKVNKPSGTYKTGDSLVYTVTFRNPVNSDDSKLVLGNATTQNWKRLTRTSVSEDKKVFTYTYTVGANEDIKNVYVTGLEGTFTDEYGNNINSFVTLDANKIGDVTEGKVINIDKNAPPKVTNVELSTNASGYQILTITYDQVISKNTAEKIVELEMTDTYKAPAYFTKENWTNYSSNATIAGFYESNTLGCDENGKMDLIEKFVLKFNENTDNSTLTTALKNKGAHKASLSQNSSDVTIGGTGGNEEKQIIFNFKNSIPVKGATYKVTIPAQMVINTLNTASSEGKKADNSNFTVSLQGVEKPVIRIEKVNETVRASGITQPETARAKIDCQTPDATVRYKTVTSAGNDIRMVEKGSDKVQLRIGNNDNNYVTSAPTHDLTTFPGGNGTPITANATFNLTAGDGNTQNGCHIRIQATATKGSDTATSYDQAIKTVIKLINRNSAGGYKYRAIRGGDKSSGGVATPNFPFSWNTDERNKIRIMTGDGNNNGSNYYFITWKITTTAYVSFLAIKNDNISNSYNEENGPSDWWWASCGWVPNVEEYPIYPGETTTCDANNVLTGKSNGFGFLDKHKQSRSPD